MKITPDPSSLPLSLCFLSSTTQEASDTLLAMAYMALPRGTKVMGLEIIEAMR